MIFAENYQRVRFIYADNTTYRQIVTIYEKGTIFCRLGKGKAKFGGKNKGKAFKPGTPQNKKAKSKGKKGGKKAKKGGKKAGKGAKKSSPLSIPAGGGALAFGVPFTGFDGVVVPGLAAAGFDYVAG